MRRLEILTSLRTGILSLTMSFALLGIMLPPAAAQEEQIGVIQSIKVLGNQRIERSTIMSYISVAKGSIFDPVLIDRSLKDLFATGLFADVNIAREGQILIITVVLFIQKNVLKKLTLTELTLVYVLMETVIG